MVSERVFDGLSSVIAHWTSRTQQKRSVTLEKSVFEKTDGASTVWILAVHKHTLRMCVFAARSCALSKKARRVNVRGVSPLAGDRMSKMFREETNRTQTHTNLRVFVSFSDCLSTREASAID